MSSVKAPQAEGARGGVVAAGDVRTARAGAQMLESGGNAIDAVVAASFAAFSSEPILTGPFGGGFATVSGPDIEAEVFDFFADTPGIGLGPAREQPELDFVAVEIDFGATTQPFHVGRGASASPLMLQGLVSLHERLGRLPLATVLEPGRQMAIEGVEISEGTARFVKILEPILTLTPEARRLFAPSGEVLKAGERFVSRDLGRLIEHAATGDLEYAEAALLNLCGPPVGRLTADDFKHTQVAERGVASADVKGHRVCLNSAPSSGGLLVAFGLRLLEQVPDHVWKDDVLSAKHVAAAMAMTNAARASALDRAIHAVTTDAEAAAVQSTFLGDAFIDQWRESFEKAAREGLPEEGYPVIDLGGTTHISVLDNGGLACGITSSNGEGCGWVVPGAGVLANNFMGEDDLHPNGFHQSPAGSRLTSMMCPTVIERDGLPEVVLGTGGSNRIRTALLQVITSHLYRGMSLEDAVRAPRMHYEGKVLFVELHGPGTSLPASVAHALKGHCHGVVEFEEPNMFFGGVHAAGRGGHGIGDPRRSGVLEVVS